MAATSQGAQPPSTEKPQRRRWTGGQIAIIVVATLMGLIGLAMAVGGGFGIWLTTQRDSDGFVMTSSERFATGSYALATRSLEVSTDVPSFLYGESWLGTVRVKGESANPSRPLFIGIGRRSDVQAYLARVAHADVVNIESNPFKASYRPQPGGAPRTPPVRARFWVARVSGPGTQKLDWKVKSGTWSVVVMRPDGSRGVVADVGVGAKVPALVWVSLGLLLVGLALLAGAGALIYFKARGPRGSPVAQPESGPPAG
jgi:hypothetical protein